ARVPFVPRVDLAQDRERRLGIAVVAGRRHHEQARARVAGGGPLGEALRDLRLGVAVGRPDAEPPVLGLDVAARRDPGEDALVVPRLPPERQLAGRERRPAAERGVHAGEEIGDAAALERRGQQRRESGHVVLHGALDLDAEPRAQRRGAVEGAHQQRLVHDAGVEVRERAADLDAARLHQRDEAALVALLGAREPLLDLEARLDGPAEVGALLAEADRVVEVVLLEARHLLRRRGEAEVEVLEADELDRRDRLLRERVAGGCLRDGGGTWGERGERDGARRQGARDLGNSRDDGNPARLVQASSLAAGGFVPPPSPLRADWTHFAPPAPPVERRRISGLLLAWTCRYTHIPARLPE